MQRPAVSRPGAAASAAAPPPRRLVAAAALAPQQRAATGTPRRAADVAVLGNSLQVRRLLRCSAVPNARLPPHRQRLPPTPPACTLPPSSSGIRGSLPPCQARPARGAGRACSPGAGAAAWRPHPAPRRAAAPARHNPSPGRVSEQSWAAPQVLVQPARPARQALLHPAQSRIDSTPNLASSTSLHQPTALPARRSACGAASRPPASGATCCSSAAPPT